jgi:DUF971 family protein
MQPIKIRLSTEKQLAITWDDLEECLYPLALLRRRCPCATCQTDAAANGPAYIPLFTKDALTIDAIQPVGYYALQFRWKDGHDTGIFSYEYLRSLCPEASPKPD